jgi:hypothetical protein
MYVQTNKHHSVQNSTKRCSTAPDKFHTTAIGIAMGIIVRLCLTVAAEFILRNFVLRTGTTDEEYQ